MPTTETTSATRVGETLCGKWTLERLLGEGGMASVYVARHKIGRLDAIKILHPALAATPQLRARFEQEAHVVNRFRHRGAVEVRDIDTTEDGSPFIVMELLEGETLSAMARRSGGVLDVATVLQMADEVLDVLAAAHAQGIIHRDIKPDNLLRLIDGHIKVLDFGIARVREGLGGGDMKTRTGTMLGTVAYMPPEQAKGIDIDGRADVYAVGATMFRLLTGKKVHEADTEADRFVKVVSQPAPSLASVAPAVPGAVCAVVDRSLAFSRDRRYADAASMQGDVRAVLRGEAPPVASVPSAVPESVPPVVPAGAAAQGASSSTEAPTRAEGPNRVDPPTLAEGRAAPPASQMATQVNPEGPSQVTTVAGTVAPTPAMFATKPIPAPAPAPSFAPAPAPASRRRALVLVAIVAGALLVTVIIGLLITSSSSSAPPAASGSPTPSAQTAEPEPTMTANETTLPTASPTPKPPSPLPAPPPAPVPPNKKGHH